MAEFQMINHCQRVLIHRIKEYITQLKIIHQIIFIINTFFKNKLSLNKITQHIK